VTGCQRGLTETAFLEFHQVEPYATGGPTTAGNSELRWRAHNQYEAELFFGMGSDQVREDVASVSRIRGSTG
jgi:hypothetical protein